MIPIIIGIVAAAGIGGALNAAGRATNEDYQCELNSICNKIEYLCKKTKEDADTSMANFQESLRSLENYKEVLQNTTIEDFSEVYKRINNINYELFSKSSQNFKFISGNIDFLKVGYKPIEYDVARNVAYASDFVLAPVAGGIMFISKLVQGVQLSYKIDEANAELARVKAECEKAQIQIRIVNDTASKCQEVTQVLKAVNKVLTRLTYRIEEELELYSTYNFEELPYETQQLIMTGLNVCAGLNKIIVTKVVNEDGTINQDFVGTVNEIKQISG